MERLLKMLLSFVHKPLAMTKKLPLILFTFISALSVNAQVRESRVTIDITVRTALQFESDLSQSEAENAIESYFDTLHIEKEKGKGFIIKKSLGYMLFKRAKVENVNDTYDYYFVVENKKQKGKDASIVSIAIGKGINNFFTSGDKNVLDEVKQFAEFMQTNFFEQYKLYTQLANVSKDMDKKKKKLDDLLKEKSELESNISNDSLQIINFNEALLKLKARKQ